MDLFEAYRQRQLERDEAMCEMARRRREAMWEAWRRNILPPMVFAGVLVLAAIVGVILGGCHPADLPRPPAPYTTSDRDGLDTTLGAACEQLRRVGCPEGWPNRRGSTCYEVLRSAVELVTVPDVCLRAAASVDDVRACGSSTTLRVRCVMPTVFVKASEVETP